MTLDKNNPYHEDFFKSIKYMQSEMGVVGDPSPNLELAAQMVQTVGEKFQREGLSHEDSIFMVSSVRLGVSIDGSQAALNTYVANRGTDEEHIRTFHHFLCQFPQFIPVLLEAAHRAAATLQRRRYPEEEGGE